MTRERRAAPGGKTVGGGRIRAALAVTAVAIAVAGCASWEPYEADPGRVHVVSAGPYPFRVTLEDGSRWRLGRMEVRTDSILARGYPADASRQQVDDVALARASVVATERRRYDWRTSLAIGLGLAAGVAVGFSSGF